MSLKTTGQGIGGMIMFATAIFIAVVTVAALGLAWQQGFGPWAKQIERDINHNSQQYQDAKVQELRNLVVGITSSYNEGQKQVLTNQFCASWTELTSPPGDLVSFQAQHC